MANRQTDWGEVAMFVAIPAMIAVGMVADAWADRGKAEAERTVVVVTATPPPPTATASRGGNR